MFNLIPTVIFLLAIYTLSKGSHMETRIDKIDVTNDHHELVALFYRIELRNLVQRLLYRE